MSSVEGEEATERGSTRRRPSRPRRNLLRFTNCRLLHPFAGAVDGGGLIDADLLVDVGSGLIVGMIPELGSSGDGAGGEGIPRDGRRYLSSSSSEGGEEKKEDGDDVSAVRSDDVVETVDCRGGVLSPGFIDLQLNGAFGVDFSDPAVTPSQVRSVARKLVSHGVTSFCPTIISSSRDTYRKVIPTLGRMCERHRVRAEEGNTSPPSCGGDAAEEVAREGAHSDNDAGNRGARLLGLHLEGPFFAPAKRGAHPAPHILDPIDGLSTVLDTYGASSGPAHDGVRIVTLAPERRGAVRAAAGLAESGVVVAMGHTEATLEQGRAAVREGGATLVTHLFNAMRPFHHREPGLVGLLLASDDDGAGRGGSERPYWSVVADGVHVHPCAVRMARCAHRAGAVLVTDAISAMGLGDGVHTLGNTSVDVSAGRATVAGTDTLAGSVASMDECVRLYKEFSGCGTAEALRAATLHPARVLGIDGTRGRLARGCDADLVLLDGEDLKVVGTWVGGRRVCGVKGIEKGRKKRKMEGGAFDPDAACQST